MKKFTIISAAELMKKRYRRRTHVGKAKYNKKLNVITQHVSDNYDYEVDLDRCQTAGGCLDWIHQISEKGWDKEILSDFLELLFEYIPTELWADKI